MKGRLVFKDNTDKIVTADIDIEMTDTKGIYSDPYLNIYDLKIIGIQWLPANHDPQININSGIEGVEIFDSAVSNIMESLEKMREVYCE